MCNTSEVLEHLELTGCNRLTEYFIESMFKNNMNLNFVDLSHIPVMTMAFWEVLRQHRPELLGRRFKMSDVDPKDNMLRVPLRIAEKKKKKKGKKKKKK